MTKHKKIKAIGKVENVSMNVNKLSRIKYWSILVRASID